MFVKDRFTFNIHNGWWFGNERLGRNYVYIYQLQKLYFALTGEELEINQWPQISGNERRN